LILLTFTNTLTLSNRWSR